MNGAMIPGTNLQSLPRIAKIGVMMVIRSQQKSHHLGIVMVGEMMVIVNLQSPLLSTAVTRLLRTRMILHQVVAMIGKMMVTISHQRSRQRSLFGANLQNRQRSQQRSQSGRSLPSLPRSLHGEVGAKASQHLVRVSIYRSFSFIWSQ